MIDNEELMTSYKELDFIDKIKEYSKLLNSTNKSLDYLLKNLGYDKKSMLKNFSSKDPDRDEVMCVLYENMFNIKNKAVALASYLNNKNQENSNTEM